MTNQQHPITPPPELVEQWWNTMPGSTTKCLTKLATQAAQWGADQELEACEKWVASHFDGMMVWSATLRAARRPKPPSLKEQALALIYKGTDLEGIYLNVEAHKFIRRALEALPE